MLANAVLVALIVALAAAQTPDSCSAFATGDLALREASNDFRPPQTYVGTISGVTRVGLDGNHDALLVSQYKNGTALSPQSWDFLQCSNLDNSTLPPGYTYPSSGPTNVYFGIIRPTGDTEGCLTLGSRNDNTTGVNNVLVVAAKCEKVEARYRTFMIEDYIYGGNSDGLPLYYDAANDTAFIEDTEHKEVVLRTNYAGSSSSALQLTLLNYNMP